MKTKHQLNLSAPVIHRGDQTLNNPIRRRWFALRLGGFVFTSLFALPAPPVEAQCQQYDVSGQWTIEQGSYIIPVALSQNGKTVSGTASQVSQTGVDNNTRVVQGQVNGTVEGDGFNVEINWSGGGAGVYRGTIDQDGKLKGRTYDKNKPSSTGGWYTQHGFSCADANVEKPTSASQQTAPATSAKPPAPNAADWVGRWDTTTDQGGHFELVLTQDGDAITGIFRDLNGNPQYNGTLIGTLSGKTLKYRFTQLKSAGLGEFNIANAGRTISGEGRMNDADKTHFAWWGFKTK